MFGLFEICLLLELVCTYDKLDIYAKKKIRDISTLTIKGQGILGSAMKIRVNPEIFLTCLYASHIVADHRSIWCSQN